jgi:hypothetical protein
MTVEEFVVPVTVHPDGVLVDEGGNLFGAGVGLRKTQDLKTLEMKPPAGEKEARRS